MKNKKILYILFSVIFVISAVLFTFNKLSAHCDTLDGPVVKAAQDALEKNNINLILIWVQPDDESIIREAFDKTLSVRKLSPEAKELADMNFFETVVRVHRSGEGAAYTGLKPAGSSTDPAIIAIDKAVITGNDTEVKNLIKNKIEENLNRYFNELMEKKNYDPDNVSAGRQYVKAYVEYLHFAEKLYEAARKETDSHKHGK